MRRPAESRTRPLQVIAVLTSCSWLHSSRARRRSPDGPLSCPAVPAAELVAVSRRSGETSAEASPEALTSREVEFGSLDPHGRGRGAVLLFWTDRPDCRSDTGNQHDVRAAAIGP